MVTRHSCVSSLLPVFHIGPPSVVLPSTRMARHSIPSVAHAFPSHFIQISSWYVFNIQSKSLSLAGHGFKGRAFARFRVNVTLPMPAVAGAYAHVRVNVTVISSPRTLFCPTRAPPAQRPPCNSSEQSLFLALSSATFAASADCPSAKAACPSS